MAFRRSRDRVPQPGTPQVPGVDPDVLARVSQLARKGQLEGRSPAEINQQWLAANGATAPEMPVPPASDLLGRLAELHGRGALDDRQLTAARRLVTGAD